MVKMDSGGVLNVAPGSALGSLRPGTDVALTFEMSLGVMAFRLQLGHLATDALMQFIYRQW